LRLLVANLGSKASGRQEAGWQIRFSGTGNVAGGFLSMDRVGTIHGRGKWIIPSGHCFISISSEIGRLYFFQSNENWHFN
jgi:hypothetical protein